VNYQTELFLEKNRDYIVLEHQALLSSSKCLFISGLFGLQKEEPSRSSYKFSSVASRFKVDENFKLKFLLFILSFYCDSTEFRLIFFLSATTPSTYGNTKFNRTSLYSVYKTKLSKLPSEV
jgi:hypothetical protein